MKKTNTSKKQTRKIAGSKVFSKLVNSLVLYIIFVSSLAAYASQNINTSYAKANDGLVVPTTKDLLSVLFMFLGVYMTRAIILLLPAIITRWKKVLSF
jgi:Sec-independent protein secretion pathway component TatC